MDLEADMVHKPMQKQNELFTLLWEEILKGNLFTVKQNPLNFMIYISGQLIILAIRIGMVQEVFSR
ncbi:hypothetical protein JCM19039_3287 [Geomicrobium sp. JCM 19039]|nr:hypothetical protein JCM19039_3287 [Geomicrobium sp. JCM 19039]